VNDVPLIVDQVFALADGALGIAPNQSLESAIVGYQNALNADPFVHSLFGQELLTLIEFEILSNLTGSAT
jgi:hypothetical protein